MVTWRDAYSIGIEEIDNQHKKLFEITSYVFNALKDDFSIDKQEKIIYALEELKNYTILHFSTEEQYMLSINYPYYSVQKAEHDAFIVKLQELNFPDLIGNQDLQLHELLKWTISWISKHILEKDMLIGKYKSTL